MRSGELFCKWRRFITQDLTLVALLTPNNKQFIATFWERVIVIRRKQLTLIGHLGGDAIVSALRPFRRSDWVFHPPPHTSETVSVNVSFMSDAGPATSRPADH